MSRPVRILLTVCLAALVVGATASPASAQYGPPPRSYGYPPPPPPTASYRSGLVVGVGVGVGGISASNCAPGYCGAAISGEFHIGGMLNYRLALEGEVWGNARTISNTGGDGTLSQSFWTVAAQYWLIEQLWIKGGLGIAHVQVSSDSLGTLDDETALGLVLAAGGEIFTSNNFALDLQLRFGHGFYDEANGGAVNNYALLIGFNWY
ncbi:MAG: hypothetical protein JWM82_2147 [Myxococcales bacterium]|nr:hypothetical protein [Myxococcales bacterium]